MRTVEKIKKEIKALETQKAQCDSVEDSWRYNKLSSWIDALKWVLGESK